MAEQSAVDRTIKEEESNFIQLFQLILQEIRNEENVEESDIENAITDMKEGFKSFKFPDMKQWKNVCGYLFRYGPHGAGLTRNRVLYAVRNYEDLAQSLKQPNLNIVSLGGGPGNDIIGFCSALFECEEGTLRNLNITVVDKYIEWSKCVDLLKELVLDEEELVRETYGNVSRLLHRIDVTMSFLQVNISPGMRNENFYHFLREADVILMVKLASSMNLQSMNALRKTLIKTMKDEALLLHIDSSIDWWGKKYFEILFKSNLENYSMSTETNIMFNSNDVVGSKAQISVLRKRRL